MKVLRAATATLALVVASALPLGSQARPAPDQNGRGTELTISLVTMGPGTEVWERFGHNAIRVHDSVRHTDLQYNYGLFDFRQEKFYTRFAQGRMLYSMGGFDAVRDMARYAAENRSVWVQELNLTPAQRADLRDFLEWNALPEHRDYHYDYYRDNCSTRVRDAIDRVIGGRIRAATDTVPTGTTFRSHTARLTSAEPLVYTGLMIGLGAPVDRPISAYEETFLPLALREQVRGISLPGADGMPVPLVRSERTVYLSTTPDPPAEPPRWAPVYLAIGLVVGGLLVLLGRGAAAASPGAAAGLAVAGGLWGLISGLLGTILAGLWAFTDHVAAYANENLFQLDPLALGLAVLVPAAVLSARSNGRRAMALSAATLAVALLGLTFKLWPGRHQVNDIVLALALPIHLGLWLALRTIHRARAARAIA
ncbi:MAG: DUF4105 domain-containing protein [Gemmatimonadales bacterium]|nr:DUF4105 domain-containing protein [Gemmatimonadales bacterium]